MKSSKHIVLLTTKYADDKKDAWLTNELAYSLNEEGHDVSVVVFSWLKNEPVSFTKVIDGIKVIRVKLPAIFYNTGVIGTSLKIFLFPFLARHEVRKQVSKCDLLIANTPCVTILGMSRYFRKKFDSKSFLVLWDFFPYYLKDLGAIRNKLFFGFFRYLEQIMYKSFDRIGCMTEGNARFLFDNFPTVDKQRVEILPLWAKIKQVDPIDKSEIRLKYDLPSTGFIAVYGGAMSIVQELDNILDLAELYTGDDVTFLFIGKGTEKERLEESVFTRGLKNVKFINYVPRDEYQHVVQACDVGLISLSRKLTVPSFPSKSLDYFKVSLPVLASLDSVTDFGDILENKICAGLAVVAGDVTNLKNKLDLLIKDAELCKALGANGRRYYEKYLSVENARSIIISSL
ncbi:glycosyltransferase family 4 protein [Pseudomonas sp. PDM32]|uniref:glycosyltransferase family 4 protein n=1 Tax=Pseudomonas sp. PDM32 TaxID=2854768 RepID=UPI001C48A0C1|nr:glycosyltransferase family 4 protein [Pseudomonas sp. PDM32]MBV7573764.1 glycosyltransferase family 4 protein [Pseudomonas sp. PDM32]